jgi:trans-aconitate methyltransferase
MTKIESCPISGSVESIDYLDLGLIPLVNNLCATREESLNAKRYPLVVQLFPESGLSCLTELVPKEELFCQYLYRSGVNKPYLTHCAEMYDYLEGYVNLENGGVVVDIGGNDGSLLREFQNKNPKPDYINVDPCPDFMEENMASGIDFFNAFWDEKSVQLDPKATLITTTNVFQHNKDIRSFVKGVTLNLADDGVWCLEFPYWPLTMIVDNYDQIYHEHIYYYRLKNIVDLLRQEGLKVVNASYHNMHSGTLRVIAVKSDCSMVADSSVRSFLNFEDYLTPAYMKKWGQKITQKTADMENAIRVMVHVCNDTIIGFGAAAKGCVFLNSCHLSDNQIMFVIDDTPEKQGKYIPGTGIEIVSREILKRIEPDYILILAHNFKKYIMESLRKDGYKGKFLVMLPTMQIV